MGTTRTGRGKTFVRDQNKILVQRFFDEVFNNARPGAIDGLIADDYLDHSATPEQAPGPTGARQMHDVFRTAFPDLRVTVHEMLAEGDFVACRTTFAGTSRGPLMGAPPTGKPVQLSSMVFLRLRNGKIVERWEQADLLGLMLQLGIVTQGDNSGDPQ